MGQVPPDDPMEALRMMQTIGVGLLIYLGSVALAVAVLFAAAAVQAVNAGYL
jgi:hypothetical protein